MTDDILFQPSELRAAVAEARTRKQLESIRRALPYGQYLLADGGRVLYNRRYEPILGFTPGGGSFPATGWIRHVRQEWFYADSTIDNAQKFATYRANLVMLVDILGGADPTKMSLPM